MVLARAYSAPPLPPFKPPKEPLKLPGLVSAIRPLKRIATQLDEESLLLRRFSYKNKNQFKGCGWWRKIMEVDRIMGRLGPDIAGLLTEFGGGIASDGKEVMAITPDGMVAGLLRLPRVMMIVDKTLSVLLGCASILEQLIHTRAFLAFAVVVVSLVARLHALSVVLNDDLASLASVITRLVAANSKVFPSLGLLLSKTPRSQRQLLLACNSSSAQPDSDSQSRQPIASGSQSPFQARMATDDTGRPFSRDELSGVSKLTSRTEDDLGALVSRLDVLSKKKKQDTVGLSRTSTPPLATPPLGATPPPLATPMSSVDHDSPALSPLTISTTLSLSGSDAEKNAEKKEKKAKKRVTEVGEEPKRKKKKKKEGSDIMSMFD